jgi:hypothetical protein
LSSFETFRNGLVALQKASPLRFCSSGLLADLYKRLYWEEAAVLDVVKEVFVQETLEVRRYLFFVDLLVRNLAAP